jgi:hypothetical protein
MALPSFLAGQGFGLSIGVVAGAFMPAVGRKIKALFLKVVNSIKSRLSSEAVKVVKKLE